MPSLTLDALVAYVQSGGISFPTDTLAAVAALPRQGQRLYKLKQRPPEKPLILMAATADELWSYTVGQPAERRQWADVVAAHWPGPLTLVLPASDRLPAAMNPLQTGTIGIRIPNHPVARRVLALTGPLATTSTNRSGEPALNEPPEIAAAFPEVGLLETAAIDQILAQADNASANTQPRQASGIASTVAQWTDNDWQIIRQGTIHL